MKEEAVKLMRRAADCISDAEANVLLGRWVVCVNRSYYAIFDCARALLVERDVFAKTHQGVYVKFNELFVKPNLFAPQLQQVFREVFELRQAGDYDLDAEIEEADAHFAIKSSKDFFEASDDWLKAQNYLTSS